MDKKVCVITGSSSGIGAASAILFAAATLFNANMSASSTSSQGIGLRNAPAKLSEPVIQVGPTIPPNPWEDEAPSTLGGSSLQAKAAK